MMRTQSEDTAGTPTNPETPQAPSRTPGVFSSLATLVSRMEESAARDAQVIPWGCPVPTFGDVTRAKVASLGLNPSSREFVDEQGQELLGSNRRFHTLRSLELESWAAAESRHLKYILEACLHYFTGNPYDRWFRRLDFVISGTGSSFYDRQRPACHLDVIPYATARKWTDLSTRQRGQLLDLSRDALGLLLRHASVEVLVLNGQSVVTLFQTATGMTLGKREMPAWSLPRRSGAGVTGVAYAGLVDTICGYRLPEPIRVLGFNHNLQSSYGVTTRVVDAIRSWITSAACQDTDPLGDAAA